MRQRAFDSNFLSVFPVCSVFSFFLSCGIFIFNGADSFLLLFPPRGILSWCCHVFFFCLQTRVFFCTGTKKCVGSFCHEDLEKFVLRAISIRQKKEFFWVPLFLRRLLREGKRTHLYARYAYVMRMCARTALFEVREKFIARYFLSEIPRRFFPSRMQMQLSR